MLIFLAVLFAILCAVALCFGVQAFQSLMWLWLLPVGFLGGFLLAAGLAFGFLVLVSALVDPDKPYEKDTPWFRRMLLWYIDAILTLLPIRIRTQGLEKTPAQGRFLLVCNHLDNIDPAFILQCFPKSQLAFVAKREVREMFLVGRLLPKLLCSFINRENDREALKTILRCISLLKEDEVSVAIFPEGRINPYRKLAHFRPGVFKIAQKANVPIVVCTMRNTNTVIPRLMKCKGSTVDLHLLDVIPAEALQGRTTTDIAQQVYEMMAADLGAENVLTPEEEENT